jgi:ankyrin repeat protein
MMTSLLKNYTPDTLNAVFHPEDGLTPLHRAVFREQTKIVSMLITAGIDVNAQLFGDTLTSLQISVIHRRNPEIADLLVKGGADINCRVKTNTGEIITLLEFCEWNRDIEMLNILLKCKK